MTINEEPVADDLKRFVYQNAASVYVLNLGICDCSILEYLLSPAFPYVWLRKHMPHPAIQWWATQVPLSTAGAMTHLKVRELTYDLQMDIQLFFGHLREFIPYGVELYQFDRPIPDTLTLSHVPDNQKTKILLNNGAQAAFFLPHANEQAQYWAVSRHLIEQVLRRPQVMNIVIAR